MSTLGELPIPSMELTGPLVSKRITLCVSGSVAAYKALLVARLLVRAGAIVQPVMTRAARHFVGHASLSGLTGRPVRSSMFQGVGEPHVELGQSSDLIAVVPTTADLLARIAHGRADDLVTATVLCASCPVLLAPAMHPRMWEHPMTQSNVARLRAVPGWQLVGPAFGEVASGEVGWGRLLEPEEIVRAIEKAAASLEPPPPSAGQARLDGRRVVVTAGPTLEDLDPVRALTNRSSGKMGFAIARAAALRGAHVTLIAGPVALDAPAGVERVDVRSALDMQAALTAALGEDQRGADAVVMCAAVSDYRPRARSTSKLKRSSGELALELVPNPDLLAEIGHARKGALPFLLGFAVETEVGERLVAAARAKLSSKRVDAIVANAAADALGTDDTRAIIVTRDSERALAGSKLMVSEQIVEFLATRLA